MMVAYTLKWKIYHIDYIIIIDGIKVVMVTAFYAAGVAKVVTLTVYMF